MRKAFFSVLFSFILCAALAVQVQAKEFILMASTIGLASESEKFPKANHQDAMKLVQWFTSLDKGQKLIVDFGIDTHGSQLFFPNSPEWQALQGKN